MSHSNKLLLVDDVDKLGRAGDIVTAKGGFARNFLLPKGLAVIATKQTLRMQARLQEERRQRAIKEKAEAERINAQLEQLSLTVEVKVDHEGHMYGSVSVQDIVQLLKDNAGVELEKKDIQLKHPVKQTGEHTIPLKLKEGVVGQVKLKIIPEGAVADAEEGT